MRHLCTRGKEFPNRDGNLESRLSIAITIGDLSFPNIQSETASEREREREKRWGLGVKIEKEFRKRLGSVGESVLEIKKRNDERLLCTS